MNSLAVTADRLPDAPALADLDRTLTYRELAKAAARVAGALAALGVGPGDRVATCLPTTLEHAIVIHGIGWLGAAVVPMHPRLAPSELAWQVADVAAQRVITADLVPKLLIGSVGRPAHSPEPGDVASILYTSGTTGRPKPVPLTWANHRASVAGSVDRLGSEPDDDWLCPLPLAHIAGLAVLYRSVTLGTAATLLDGFDPEAVADLLAAGRIRMASMVPTMVRRLVGLGRPLPAPRLRVLLMGGGPADADTQARALALGLPLAHSYGLTETASQFSTLPPQEAGRKAGTAGRPLAGAEVAIRDEVAQSSGQPVVPGASGAIWVRGPMVMAGYLDRPEENAARFDPDGWFSTGDLGRVDADGYLTIESRREDLIVTGGENVYPAEVETALLSHPAVAECAVFGLPDAEWGQCVAAAVVLRPTGVASSAAELANHLRGQLAPFKIPKTWIFRTALPRTASGKVQRIALRGEMAASTLP